MEIEAASIIAKVDDNGHTDLRFEGTGAGLLALVSLTVQRIAERMHQDPLLIATIVQMSIVNATKEED